MNIPICVRDGCETGIIKIGDLEFELDLTELNTIFEYAHMEMRRSRLSHRQLLMQALDCLEEYTCKRMEIGPRQSSEDMNRNLARYRKTGCGGHHNLKDAWRLIQKIGGNIPRGVSL